MNRKKFIKNAIAGTVGIVASGRISSTPTEHTEESTYDRLMDQVGFNHLPNKEIRTMKTVLHKASSRGIADHGWLKSNHSFSFANYYNPERMNFGVLRVLNDDVVAASKGFGMHPHDNMEIISIPLEGELEHKDSMGNVASIRQGDVQVMSAGTGIRHSEYNKKLDRAVKFLQIWLFPNKRGVTPRYDQMSLDIHKRNELQQIVSPNPDDDGVWIHQNAWFYMGDLDVGYKEMYQIKNAQNGVYIFVLEGSLRIGEQEIADRDGLGIWDVDRIAIEAMSKVRILVMDVPMTA